MSKFIQSCPECSSDLEDMPELGMFYCEECDTMWISCPDCGNLVSFDEDWNPVEKVCRECEVGDDDYGITVISFENTEKMFEAIEQIFGEDEREC